MNDCMWRPVRRRPAVSKDPGPEFRRARSRKLLEDAGCVGLGFGRGEDRGVAVEVDVLLAACGVADVDVLAADGTLCVRGSGLLLLCEQRLLEQVLVDTLDAEDTAVQLYVGSPAIAKATSDTDLPRAESVALNCGSALDAN